MPASTFEPSTVMLNAYNMGHGRKQVSNRSIDSPSKLIVFISLITEHMQDELGIKPNLLWYIRAFEPCIDVAISKIFDALWLSWNWFTYSELLSITVAERGRELKSNVTQAFSMTIFYICASPNQVYTPNWGVICVALASNRWTMKINIGSTDGYNW